MKRFLLFAAALIFVAGCSLIYNRTPGPVHPRQITGDEVVNPLCLMNCTRSAAAQLNEGSRVGEHGSLTTSPSMSKDDRISSDTTR